MHKQLECPLLGSVYVVSKLNSNYSSCHRLTLITLRLSARQRLPQDGNHHTLAEIENVALAEAQRHVFGHEVCE